MDYKLELVLVPVADVDRAKTFYTEKVGFNLDVDHRAGDDFRVVQMPPPGARRALWLLRFPERPPRTSLPRAPAPQDHVRRGVELLGTNGGG